MKSSPDQIVKKLDFNVASLGDKNPKGKYIF